MSLLLSTASREATTVSTQPPAAGPSPWLVTFQVTVTSAGSPIVWAGAVTSETTRSGYGARADVRVRVAVLLVSPVLVSLNSAIRPAKSVWTVNWSRPAPSDPSGSLRVSSRGRDPPPG